MIMEEREEFMVPFNGGIPTLRRAHFLKPVTNNLTKTLSVSGKTISKLNEGQLKVDFRGRKYPQKRWKKWVDQLRPQYQYIWKKAGIFEGIVVSTYKIFRDNGLLIKLAEKWSEETNTFVFPWGEATVTLEDMTVLGGYSVLGESVLISVEREDSVEKQESLNRAYRDVRLKMNLPVATDTVWMDHFMGSNDRLEHEAFLSLWLSRFVFPIKYGVVGNHVFPLAIHLSVGIQIALAPAVLASIYRDLTLLKHSIVDLAQKKRDKSRVTVWAPFQLVQLWAWERFPSLGPIPNALKCEEPRAARWHRLRKPKGNDIMKGLDCSGKTFQWRPYTTVLRNWDFSKFYWENEEYVVLVESNVDMKLDSFARCLRLSELVGMDCVEHYFPHRVAMQFGLDQDIPGHVCMSNQSPRIAWDDYIRPITYSGFYIPPRLLESDVTTKYVEWWNQTTVVAENSKEIVAKDRMVEVEDHIEGTIETHIDEDDELTIAEAMRRRKMHLNVENDIVVNQTPFSGPENSSSSAVLGKCGKKRGEDMNLNKQRRTLVDAVEIVTEAGNLAKEENGEMSEAKLEEGNVELATSRVLGIELEARVKILERIIGLSKAGKLVPDAEKIAKMRS
ncbi:hypothetical protein BUALT_Bualt03G0118300 [Buddleja alternifolia]|uniref:Aminotransferase-like plant mobile domain-containing protein n=1 Tax=Buddleja alternifolia TaxID=168488 RepID=A0AAV6XZQ8_9LAMI|nr:hypothetical protein BUALT_Bualt03G0118300 [Buddleja alternifolia]